MIKSSRKRSPSSLTIEHRQLATGFTPSNLQVRFFFYYFCYPFLCDDPDLTPPQTWHDALGRHPSISDVCAFLGLSRAAVYKWFANPHFCQWWNAQIPSLLSVISPKIAHQFLFHIRSGKVSAINLFFKILTQKYPDQPADPDFDYLALLDSAIPNDPPPSPRVGTGKP
ncbi:MAG: phBC6A51 family helix-turn-helix protein [bacterium]